MAAIARRKTTAPDTARKPTVGAWIRFSVDLVLTPLGMYGDSHPSSAY